MTGIILIILRFILGFALCMLVTYFCHRKWHYSKRTFCILSIVALGLSAIFTYHFAITNTKDLCEIDTTYRAVLPNDKAVLARDCKTKESQKVCTFCTDAGTIERPVEDFWEAEDE